MWRRKFCKGIIWGILVFFLSQGSAFSENDVEIIPVKLATKVAEYHAMKCWGKVQVGSPKLYFEMNGTPAVYVYTIFKGEKSFPTEEEIINSVSQIRSLRLEAELLLSEREMLKSKDLIKEAKKRIALLWEQMRQEENFGTLIVGASDRHMPMIMRCDGLPLHIVALEDTKQTAMSVLPWGDVKLEKVLWLDVYDLVFEFKSENKTIFVSPYSFKAFEKQEIKVSPEKIAPARIAEHSKKCKQAWDNVRKFFSEDIEKIGGRK